MLMAAPPPLTCTLMSMSMKTTRVCIVQGNEANPDDMQLAVSNPAWAQQASSTLAAATRERVELQRAAVEAEDCIVRYWVLCTVFNCFGFGFGFASHGEALPSVTCTVRHCCHHKFLVSLVLCKFTSYCQVLLCIASVSPLLLLV